MVAMLLRLSALLTLLHTALCIKMSRDWKMKRRTIHDDSWEPEETVTVRAYYGDHDRQVVLSAAIEQTTDETSGQTVTRATLDRMVAAKRTLAVVSWTLLDEDSHPLPFTTDNVLNLPQEVASFIDAEIDRDWSGIVPLAATAEEAERAAQEEREERSSFPRDGVHPAVGPGKAAPSRRHERATARDPGNNGAAAEDAAPVARVQRELLGSE